MPVAITQNPATPNEMVQSGVASPHRPNMMKIINAGATQNESESDMMSSEPPSSFRLE